MNDTIDVTPCAEVRLWVRLETLRVALSETEAEIRALDGERVALLALAPDLISYGSETIDALRSRIATRLSGIDCSREPPAYCRGVLAAVAAG